MEGIIFYWLFWTYWIIATFFLKKTHPYRGKLSAWILITIILSTMSLDIPGLNISMAILFILVINYGYAASLKKREVFYFVITSFIITLAYVSFHLFELYDPVWVIFKREWLLAILLTYLTLMLHSGIQMKLMTILTGSVHGEIIYSGIIKNLSFSYQIGSPSFLDIIALSTGFMAAWYGFEKITAFFGSHINHLEREKEKIS